MESGKVLGKKILLAEDEPAVRESLELLLSIDEHKVTAARNGREALDLFTSKDFDLVITDMTMPNLTGDRLAQELLKIRPGIPIILCTGFSELISEEKAKGLGIREFVMKPLVMKEMAQAIRRALDSPKEKKG